MSRVTIAALLVALLCFSVSLPVYAAPKDQRNADQHKQLKVLPKSHQRIVHKGKPYYYTNGGFYRSNNGVYVSITAPLGAIIPALPGGYVTFGVGSNRYFRHGGIYYQQVPTGYVVIKEPEQAATATPNESDKLIIYPAAGQSDEQKSRDKYECHEWASSETSFDPLDSSADPSLRAVYKRAMSACLEAREYVVK